MAGRRLLWHIYPSFLIITFIAILAVTLYASRSFKVFYHNQVANDLEEKARLLDAYILPMIKSGDFSQIQNLCEKLGKTGLTRITVMMPSGEIIGDSDEDPAVMQNHINRPEIQQAIKTGTGRAIRLSKTLGKNMMYFAIDLRQDSQLIAIIRTAKPLTAIEKELNNIYKKIILAGLIIAITVAVISLAISKKISHPVEEMKDIAQHFAAGDLQQRLSIPNAKELGELADALNNMASQLDERINTITRERNLTQAILSSMVEGVIAIDSSGHVISMNKAACDFLGLDSVNVFERNIEEIVREPQLQEFIQNTIEQKEPTENNVVLENGYNRFLKLYGTGLIDDNGNRSGAVVVLHDVTKTRRLEDVRRDFVANVSHELRTPITAIKGFVETLLEGAMSNPKQADRFLKIIAKQADRLNAIIEDLLSLSRLENDNEQRKLLFEQEKVKQVLLSVVELSKIKADQKQISINIDCDDALKASMDSSLIEHAVLNLVDNAIKYTQEGGKIKIHAENREGEILISVHDEGCGIAKEHLSRIFERFYVVDKGRSRKLGGTGLGLSIVKHIAQVHGGFVTIESTMGKGSTFTIHFPVS